ncbi:putative ATP-dependent DNA helicase MER3 like protein [Blattamonas nauphoetae]|uniref:DNA 3'-5' helicase n=1 Tax=Blattamonas nauphoetae TaxID=2049346 RepID=A0ABQ9XAZ7_9EUKA|nr:putative ATP-dependent DNA helicase MER3 like protein [Blattamonas nauphoetae]
MVRKDNVLVEAPTGSGKTVVFELALARLFQPQNTTSTSSDGQRKGKRVGVYIAPTKALCQEKLADWKKKFDPLGFKVTEMTGDSLYYDRDVLNQTSILVTTPEKFDSFTRKFSDNQLFIERIGLLMLDEVHIIGEDRGPTLEAVVSRLKLRLQVNPEGTEAVKSNRLRLVGVSATIPNVPDIARWLDVSVENTFTFCSSFRPVKLETTVLSYPTKSNAYLFDRNLDYKLFSVIQRFNDDQPTLVFCPTRKSVIVSATQLAKSLNENGLGFGDRIQFERQFHLSSDSSHPFVKSQEQRRILDEARARIEDAELRDVISEGIGFHSAGLSFNDRSLVEKLFANNHLLVLCTTTTLAQGVNLPAHLVVIKSTMCYRNGGGFEEYSRQALTQMMGRAGRPQFDVLGKVVIMTQEDTAGLYEERDVQEGNLQLESRFHEQMIEHLNAEIVVGNIRSMKDVTSWIETTYFFARLMKNPSHYNVTPTTLISTPGSHPHNPQEEARVQAKNLCLKNLEKLRKEGFIQMENWDSIRSTEIGASMSHYYISFETVCLFKQIQPFADLKDIIQVLSNAKEFEECRIRLGEKKKLNELNKKADTIRFPLKGKIKTQDQKVHLLIQCGMCRHQLEDWSLKQESLTILQNLKRIMYCLVDFLSGQKMYQALRSAIILSKCVQQRMWETGEIMLEQLDGIGPVLRGHLNRAGVNTFQDVLARAPYELEQITRRNAPFGEKMRKAAAGIWTFSLSAMQRETDDPQILNVTLTASRQIVESRSLLSNADPSHQTERSGTERAKFSLRLFVGNSANNIIYSQRISHRQVKDNFTVTFSVARQPRNQTINITLLNEDYVGVDCDLKMDLRFPFKAQARPTLTTADDSFEHTPSTEMGLKQTTGGCILNIVHSAGISKTLEKKNKPKKNDHGSELKKPVKQQNTTTERKWMQSEITSFVKQKEQPQFRDIDSFVYHPRPGQVLPPSSTVQTPEKKSDSSSFNSVYSSLTHPIRNSLSTLMHIVPQASISKQKRDEPDFTPSFSNHLTTQKVIRVERENSPGPEFTNDEEEWEEYAPDEFDALDEIHYVQHASTQGIDSAPIQPKSTPHSLAPFTIYSVSQQSSTPTTTKLQHLAAHALTNQKWFEE